MSYNLVKYTWVLLKLREPRTVLIYTSLSKSFARQQKYLNLEYFHLEIEFRMFLAILVVILIKLLTRILLV